MAFGVVILAHAHLHRTRALAAALSGQGVRVVIHVDARTPDSTFEALTAGLKNRKTVRFAPRISCDWGRFSLVEAGMAAASLLLEVWPDTSHVVQISGACLPVRPIADLQTYLDKHPDTDMVESVPADEPWVQGGLSEERFRFYFPFSWTKQRWLFDRCVDLQRRLQIRRKIPGGLTPHLGSQWWCLSARTLRAILSDPDRPAIDRYFRRTWIPDEGYVPTLVRKHSTHLVSRSLTLSRFDDQGKPHLFYDDHEELLARSGHFFARKIWPGASKLYRRFLHRSDERRQPLPEAAIDEVFAAARMRRCAGRPGLRNAGRFPTAAHERQHSTPRPYAVFIGFGQVFDGFSHWLGNTTGTVAHGRLFQSDRVVFSPKWQTPPAGVTANPAIRDISPENYLTNVLWADRDTRQSLMFELADGVRMAACFAADPNARIFLVEGAWMLDLFHRNHQDPGVLRTQAFRLDAIERAFSQELAIAGPSARITRLPLSRLAHPGGTLVRELRAEVAPDLTLSPRALPPLRALDGLEPFLDRLHLMGMDTSRLTGKAPPSRAMRLLRRWA